MFKCSHLSVRLASGRMLVNDVTFSMSSSDRVGLIAEEGNGKSTLMKIFAGDPPDYVSITGFFYTDLKIGLLPQQIDPVWNQETPLSYLLKSAPETEIPTENWNLLQEAETLAAEMNISLNLIYSQQTISTLSGGERIRLMFLKMMMNHPNCFLLDEPTNDLDEHALEWIENWILHAAGPVLFVSHDTRLLEKRASRILHLEQRNRKTKCISTFFAGSYQEYTARRKAGFEKQLQISKSEKREYLKQKERLNDLHNKVESRLRSVSRQDPHQAKVLKKSMKTIKTAQSHLEEQNYSRVDSAEEEISLLFPDSVFPASKTLIDLHDHSIEIGNRTLTEPFDLVLRGACRLAITGDNGSGKTTFLKEVLRILNRTPGIITGYLPQNYDDLFSADETPAQYLEKFSSDSVLARKALGSMHLNEAEMNQPVSSCSSGQKAKIILSTFLLKKCNVLLLDEPTRNLSPLSVEVLIDQLQNWRGALIAVSHDRYFIEKVFDQKAVIQKGRLTIQPVR